MKLTKVYVEAKRSKNYQTQTVGIEMEVDKEVLDVDMFIKDLQLKVNNLAVKALTELV